MYCNTHKFLRSRAAVLTLFWLFIINILKNNSALDSRALYRHQFYSSAHIRITLSNTVLLPSGRILGRQCIWVLPDNSKIFTYSISSTFTLCNSDGSILIASFLCKDGVFPPAALTMWLYSCMVTVCSVAFSANVIQFGIDQLDDSLGDHQCLFIYWYVWLEALSLFIVSVSWIFIIYSGEL